MISNFKTLLLTFELLCLAIAATAGGETKPAGQTREAAVGKTMPDKRQSA